MTNLINLAIPGFLALLILEAVLGAKMRQDLYEWKDTAASLTMGIGNVVIALVTKAIAFAAFSALYKFAPLKLGFAWWVWPLAFFADEFSYYWFHRTSHECRLFWGIARSASLVAAIQPGNRVASDLDRARSCRSSSGFGCRSLDSRP